jgi:phage-related protein
VSERRLFWAGSSLEDVRHFPAVARQRAGFELGLVQLGEMPSDWKALPSVASGVYEIRVHTEREHRILYIAHFDDGVYVLHAFEKRPQRIRRHDLDVARKRYADIVRDQKLRSKSEGISR